MAFITIYRYQTLTELYLSLAPFVAWFTLVRSE
jgi:hypothetical protein